jgi:hypothetical protein
MAPLRASFVMWTIVGSGALATGVTAFQGQPESEAPTPIEQALLNHQCGERGPSGANDAPYEACVSARLTSLRADFGRDLRKLSTAERRTVDTVCTRVRANDGREAYLACLADQLAILHTRRHPAAVAVAAPETTAAPAPNLATGGSSPRSSGLGGWWVGGGLGVLAVAAAGGMAIRLRRRRPGTCRTCGAQLAGAGELCAACRHAAGEAFRRAALERAAEEQAQQVAARQQGEMAERQRLERAQRLDEEQAQHEQRLRREARAREEADAAERRADEDRRRREPTATQAVFDPYAVLGVAPDADRDAIDAAYQAAKARYAPEEVEHLGDEAQAFYREKAAAVDRAYEAIRSKR